MLKNVNEDSFMIRSLNLMDSHEIKSYKRFNLMIREVIR